MTKADLFRKISSHIPAQKFEVKPQEACAIGLRALHSETVDTEAKFLVSGLKSGVFHSAFKIPPGEKLFLGLFGKMNLPSAEITLRDYDNGQKDYSVRLSNVQFELDLSLEDSNCLYLVEAKRGAASTFSVLQLFYPMLMVRNYARKTGKKVRAFLADISSMSNFETKYQFTECIFEHDLVPNSATLSESKIVDLFLEDPATSKLEAYS